MKIVAITSNKYILSQNHKQQICFELTNLFFRKNDEHQLEGLSHGHEFRLWHLNNPNTQQIHIYK